MKRSKKRFFGIILSVLLIVVTFKVLPVFSIFGDIKFKRRGPETDPPPAIFPHWFHRIRFKCYVCHESIFKMQAGTNEITMDAMRYDGKFCGTCHNGKIAWPIGFESCMKCHTTGN